MSKSSLVGREQQVATLMDAMRTDRLRHTVIRARPGMGKTALLSAVQSHAGVLGHIVLTAGPTEPEQRLSFSALGDLFRSLDPTAYDSLPSPQRRAIRAALLIEESDEDIDPRAVASASHGALRALAQESTVVLVIDDAQWLDEASVGALSFAVRRLAGDPVVVLAATRPSQRVVETLFGDRVDLIELGPLPLAALFHLVRGHLGLALDRGELRSLERISGGNPLFALEVARQLRAGGQLPSLDGLIDSRIRTLPRETRLAMLAAALAFDPTLDVVAEARATSPEVLLDQLEPARAEGLVFCDDHIRFGHPLFASSAVGAAAAPELRACHVALSASDPGPEAEAWHLGSASCDPDEALATKLETASQAARRRAGWDESCELMALAIERSPTADPERWRRAGQLGDWLLRAGRPTEAERWLTLCREHGTGSVRDRALLGLAWICAIGARDEEFEALLSELDHDQIPVELRARALLLDPIVKGGARLYARTRRAQKLLKRAPDSEEIAQLRATALTAEARCLLWSAQPARDLVQQAIALEEQHPADRVLESAAFLAATDALCSDRYHVADRIFRQLAASAESAGDDSSLPTLWSHVGWNDMRHARWGTARQAFEQARFGEGQRQAGVVIVDMCEAWAEGHMGAPEGALVRLADLADGFAVLGPHFDAYRLSLIGSLLLAMGRVDNAYAVLTEGIDQADRGSLQAPGVIPLETDWVETAIALGSLAEAKLRLASIEERSTRMGRHNVLAYASRCRVMLLAAQGEIARAAEAVPGMLAAHDHATQPLELGRAQLVAGRVLRRAKSKRSAHDALQEALRVFSEHGYKLYETQAQQELARIGLRPNAPSTLTPTELQVARLAADGLRNKDIAERAFCSLKTVEATLGRVYRKLGIRSRAALRAALDDKA